MTEYRQIEVYYFSGTGNSERVAHWLAEFASGQGVRAKLVNIAKADRRHAPPPDPDSLVVFTSPIHGFNYPPVMINFLLHFPRGRNHVALMNTRAGMKIGKFVTPGLTGIAFLFAWLVLLAKGYSVRAMQGIDLPSNWLSLHPGLNGRTIDYLFVRNRERVEQFAGKVLAGVRSYGALREIVQDLLVSPIAFLYYFVGRFMISKSFYASAQCDNCGACVAGCPVRGVVMTGGRPFWTFNCESCMKCMGQCPRNAIETGHGYFVGSLLLASALSSIASVHLWGYLPTGSLGEASEFICETLIALLTFWITYRFMHYMLRFRWFERAMAFTSLTWYKFWGRKYKAPKV